MALLWFKMKALLISIFRVLVYNLFFFLRYKNDTFGLQTLDKQGKLFARAYEGVVHDDWIHNQEVMDQYVVPWLI